MTDKRKANHEVVAGVPGVSAWVLRASRTVEHQRYLLFDRPESERTVESTDLSVDVFHDHDDLQGRSGFVVFGNDVMVDPRQVEKAVFIAGLQANRPYRLPGPRRFRSVNLFDDALAADPRTVLDQIQERVFAAVARETGIRLSAVEIFLTRTDTTLATSAGVNGASAATSLMFDLVVLGSDGKDESESHGAYEVRRAADLDVEAIVARHARYAREALVAELPTTRTGPVVLSHGSFTPLFSPLRFATSGEARYRKSTVQAVGRPLLGDRKLLGEALNVTSDPTLAYGGESTPFDHEGLALGPVEVVVDGVVRAMPASAQYAQYLGIPATGDWRNTVVASGAKTVAQLLDASDGPVYEIVEFSWLNPDDVRGAFGTEIRLGYEHRPDGSTRVIRGGSVAGDVYDVFAEAWLSRERELRSAYAGPRAIRFGKLQVTGA